MRYVWLGFHIVMVLLLILTFAGAFSPPKTGNFAADSGGWVLPFIGIMAIWIVGSIVLRVAQGCKLLTVKSSPRGYA